MSLRTQWWSSPWWKRVLDGNESYAYTAKYIRKWVIVPKRVMCLYGEWRLYQLTIAITNLCTVCTHKTPEVTSIFSTFPGSYIKLYSFDWGLWSWWTDECCADYGTMGGTKKERTPQVCWEVGWESAYTFGVGGRKYPCRNKNHTPG